jgi:threonine synthase
MDIQVSSNFERLLFELQGRDGAINGGSDAPLPRRRAACPSRMRPGGKPTGFSRASPWMMPGHSPRSRHLHQSAGYLADPHTAIGIAAAHAPWRRKIRAIPVVVAATAHPAKFPDAVERATGLRPPLPARLADLYDRPKNAFHTPGR